MCKIDTILAPSKHLPDGVTKTTRSIPLREIQYNSDVLREMARIGGLSVGEIIPIAARSKSVRHLRESYKKNVAPRIVARQLLENQTLK